MALVVCLKTYLVSPCCHLSSNEMVGGSFVYAVVQAPCFEPLILEHGIDGACRQHLGTRRGVQTPESLSKEFPWSFWHRVRYRGHLRPHLRNRWTSMRGQGESDTTACRTGVDRP